MNETTKSNDLDATSNLFGYKIKKQTYQFNGKKYKHKLITLFIEDDDNYFKITEFDTNWIEDLINLLNKAKKHK